MNENHPFEYTVKRVGNFDTVMQELQTAIDQHGMRVLHVHDVQATLAAKGFTHDAFKMIEFCNAAYAHALLEIDPKISVFLPCKISLYEREGDVFVSALDLENVILLFNKESVTEVLREANATVRDILEGR